MQSKLKNRLGSELKSKLIINASREYILKQQEDNKIFTISGKTPLTRQKPQFKSFDEKYHCLKILGEGAHAVVKKCHLKNDPTQVFAVKELRCRDIELVQGMKQTFFIQRLLSHPNIAKALELFYNVKTKRLCLVMEYLPYKDLSYLINRKEIVPESLLKQISYSLLNTIEYMHQRGVAHRDIKPDNILIHIENNELVDLKIIDFNVSKRIVKKQQNGHYKENMWTRTGCVFYAAPEIFREESAGYDEKVDIWSVAVILYQLATKMLPFQEESIMDTIEQILKRELSFKEEAFKNYSEYFVAFLKLLFAKIPSYRLSATEALFHIWTSNETQISNRTRTNEGMPNQRSSQKGKSRLTESLGQQDDNLAKFIKQNFDISQDNVYLEENQ